MAGQILAATQNFGVLERNPQTTLRALNKYDFTKSAEQQPGGNSAGYSVPGAGGQAKLRSGDQMSSSDAQSSVTESAASSRPPHR